jgi:hypothetical protein
MTATKKEKDKEYSKTPESVYRGEGVQVGNNNKRTKKNPEAGQSGSGHLSYGS